jgi:4a-hydroxytetrahydrobiopterin dehydratase
MLFKENKCIPCQGGIPAMIASEIIEYKKLICEQWIVEDNKELIKEFDFDSYLDAIGFANKVAGLSEEQGHHPFIHINYKIVKIILFTHKINGLHENDFLMASKIDNL